MLVGSREYYVLGELSNAKVDFIDSILNVFNFQYLMYKCLRVDGRQLKDGELQVLLVIAAYCREVKGVYFGNLDITDRYKWNNITKILELFIEMGLLIHYPTSKKKYGITLKFINLLKFIDKLYTNNYLLAPYSIYKRGIKFTINNFTDVL